MAALAWLDTPRRWWEVCRDGTPTNSLAPALAGGHRHALDEDGFSL